MAFKLSLVADVRSWLKGTADVEQSLEDIADSLDQLATDTAHSADDAGDRLERRFRDAFDEVKAEAKQAGRRVGDDLRDGTRRAEDGMDELADEANSTAREAAASFDGSAESILDAFQEVAANAFAGFGPAGALAGLAAAAGIGIAFSALETGAEKAEAAKDRVHELADALADVQGDPAAIDWAEQLRSVMQEIVDTKEWFEFWQNAPVDRLEDWTAKAKEFGVSMADAAKVAAGDPAAAAQVNAQLDATIANLNAAYAASMDYSGAQDETYRQAADRAKAFQTDLTAQAQSVADATAWQEAYTSATADLSKAQADNSAAASAAADSTTTLAQAQESAATASQTFSSSLTEHLSVADEGLDQFVEKGKLKIGEWTDELERRAKDTKAVTDFTVDVAPKLSQAALESFAQLPTETQAQIAKAYKNGGKGDRQQIVTNLEAEAKVKTVTIDTTAATADPITVETTIDATVTAAQARTAATAAQSEANKASNAIEFSTRIDRAELQRQVDRAAASIRPPTITVKTKVSKEVP